MKKLIMMSMTAIMAIITAPETFSLSPLETFAQSSIETTDSITANLKLKVLQGKRDNIQKRIKAEDAKRNQQISGVAPERLEEMNDRQDSICLALRSELTEVTLEIKELTPPVSSQAIATPLTQLINGHTPAQTDSVQPNTAKPERKPKKNNKK